MIYNFLLIAFISRKALLSRAIKNEPVSTRINYSSLPHCIMLEKQVVVNLHGAWARAAFNRTKPALHLETLLTTLSMPQCNLQHENCNSAEISWNNTIVWKTCVNNLSGQLAWSGVETLCNFFRVLHHLSFANGPQIVSMCSLPTQSNTKNLNHVRTLQFALKSKWPSFQIADIEFVIITKKKWCILIISQEIRWSKIIWGSCWGW